jgi:hypothetical protein
MRQVATTGIRMRSGVGPDDIRKAFRRGDEVLFPLDGDSSDALTSALAKLGDYLAGFAPSRSFGGVDAINADRQTLWVAKTGLGAELHSTSEEIARLDGDAAGGAAGLEALRLDTVREPIFVTMQSIDAALLACMTAIGLGDQQTLQHVTVRYRVIRYEPLERPVAGIGLHPDGNLLSGLVTTAPGLEVVDGSGVRRPPHDTTNVMPGSLLFRWSGGLYRPTFHRVVVPRGVEVQVKVSVAAFLNFPDGASIPRRPEFRMTDEFINDVKTFKVDDMDRGGDLRELWAEISS